MPRKPRFYLPGTPVHAVQRGHNKAAVFFDDFDYLEYLRCLKQVSDDCECLVHSYALMTNHIHLLITPKDSTSIAKIFQSLGRYYVRYINETYNRSGSLWEGRYKSTIIQSQTYLLACQRYIEMNPVRAGMVEHPAEYRWSSYGFNAQGISNPVVSVHSEYRSLGSTAEDCQVAYRGLFDRPLGESELGLLRAALQTGTPLGSEKFIAQVEKENSRKIGFSHRGRPRNNKKG